MRCHFYGHVGVVAEHLHDGVERGLRFGAQGGLVEVVEYVVDDIGLVDGGEYEVWVRPGRF